MINAAFKEHICRIANNMCELLKILFKKKIKGGIYNVSSKRINKYDLLNIIK